MFSGDSAPMAMEMYSDTWAYDHNASQWTNLNPENNPPVTSGHAMSYDSESDRIILFSSGEGMFGDETWAFDYNSNSWTDLNPTQKPPGRFGNNMAYDAESDRIIIFGGAGKGPKSLDDTWSYDFNTNTWTEMNPPTRPPARQYHSMAYDSESDRIILFGGASGPTGKWYYTTRYSDTWAYDYNSDTWTQMMPDTYPSARVYTDMAFNEKCDRVVLFGGGTDSFAEMDPTVLGHGNETWIYDFNSNTWQQITTDPAPTYRKKHKLAYDIESDCLILFGGDEWNEQGVTVDNQNETWEFSIATWAGYPVINGDGKTDTGDWMGLIYVKADPWLWSHKMNGWIYCPEENVGDAGGWVYIFRQ
jgi:hypothetical protein